MIGSAFTWTDLGLGPAALAATSGGFVCSVAKSIIAAAAMALSSLSVIDSSALLKRMQLSL